MSTKVSMKKTRNKNSKEPKKINKESMTKKPEAQQRKILEVLPMLQSDIWKVLKIERRQCSRILDKMIKLHLIKKSKVKGSFMVKIIDDSKIVLEKDFSALLSSNGMISPCCGCRTDCNPVFCAPLDKWAKTIEVKD